MHPFEGEDNDDLVSCDLCGGSEGVVQIKTPGLTFEERPRCLCMGCIAELYDSELMDATVS